MGTKSDLAFRTLAAMTAASLLLHGCSSGSGGSSVGDEDSIAPTARAQVLNGGETNTFREGSEVLLTGKDSEDGDGPVLDWSWEQTAGPAVSLIEVNKTTASFTVPRVAANTTLTFELTVLDADRLADSTSVDVAVVPAADADKFLSLDVRGATRNTFDRFQVVAALAEGASTDNMPEPFTLSARAFLVYPPRSMPNIECPIDSTDFAAGIPPAIASGCLVELLEDLTPNQIAGGGTGIQSEWPANVPVVVRPNGPTADQIESEWWNPRFTLRVPHLDVADFNQRFVDSGERDRFLDLFNTHKARILLSFELTAPDNQEDATLIINDLESALIALPMPPAPKPSLAAARLKIAENDQVGLPTSLLLTLEEVLGAIPGRESALTSEVYYRTVDPNSTRTTLNAWLQQAGFASDDEGTLLPEAVDGTGEFAHAVYLNNYDLGFGRDMYTRRDEFGNVYSFVVNYGTLEAAIRKNFPIATVVMEYSPLNGPMDPTDKSVKFFTYIDDGSGDSQRVTSMNFDGRGERVTPGNCVACHGGTKPPGLDRLVFDEVCADRSDAMCYTWPETNADGVDITNGNLSATFLPWDRDSMLFADTDPAITDAPTRFDGLSLGERLIRDYGDYSRATQESQLKKLNEAAYATYCNAAADPECTTDVARRFVEHWYGGVDQQGNLIGTAFDDSEAPSGWQNDELVADPSDSNLTVMNPSDAETLYHDVYAQHCRMCHANVFDPALRFDTYQKLIQNARVADLVFREGVMPAARLTMDRLWSPHDARPVPAEVLAEHLAIPEEEAAGPTPRADITLPPTVLVPRHEPVRLGAHESLFATDFDWEVSYEPVPELIGSSGVAGYEPRVIGDGTPEIAFVPERAGTYTARLVINELDPSLPPPDAFTDSQIVTVSNFLPLACDDSNATTPGGAAVVVSFLQNDRFALSGSGSDCSMMDLLAVANAPDLPLSYDFLETFDVDGQLTTSNGGTFVLDAGEACSLDAPSACEDDTLSYVPASSGMSYVDTLTYTITDTDGELSPSGIVSVEVTAALIVNAGAVLDPVSEATRTLVLSISGGALANPGEGRYTVSLTEGPVRGTVSHSGVPLSAGSSFETNASALFFSYVSDDYATGSENIAFMVTDSDGTFGSDSFPFTVLPQAPFGAPAGGLVTGQLGAVMAQWSSTDGGKDNCLTGCHGPSGTAQDRFDMAASNLGVYFALLFGTSTDGLGVVKVVSDTTQRQNNPDASIILCYPSSTSGTANRCPGGGTLPVGSPHDGLLALPVSSPSYGVIRRWIQEGAQF